MIAEEVYLPLSDLGREIIPARTVSGFLNLESVYSLREPRPAHPNFLQTENWITNASSRERSISDLNHALNLAESLAPPYTLYDLRNTSTIQQSEGAQG